MNLFRFGKTRLQQLFNSLGKSGTIQTANYNPKSINETTQMVDKFIISSPVAVFSKSYCPYCYHAKAILTSYTNNISIMEMDEELDDKTCNLAQAYLGEITGQQSVPRVFIDGKSIGGSDSTSYLHDTGDLKKMIEEAEKNFDNK